MRRTVALAVLALALCAAPTPTQEKGDKLAGTWSKKANEVEVQFGFKDRTLEVVLSAGGAKLVVHADYGTSKDGHVFGRVHKVEKEGTDAGPKQGDVFSFRYQIKGDTMKISELGGGGGAGDNEAKAIIEGEYKRVDKK